MSDYTNPFGDGYYAHRIGGRTGRLPEPSNGNDVRELRALLNRLTVGDRIVWGGQHESKTEPLHVTSIANTGDGGREWMLAGPGGGTYSITADDDAGERPRIWYYQPTGERHVPAEGGRLTTLFLVAGGD